MNSENDFCESIKNWLLNSEILCKDGAILSWLNKDKPGYKYEEITGYYLIFCSALLSLHNSTKKSTVNKSAIIDKATLSANYLKKKINENKGLGREGINYVFDESICLSGLISLQKALQTEVYSKEIKFLTDKISKNLDLEIVASKDSETIMDTERWSLSYGASSIKNLIALHKANKIFKSPSLENCIHNNLKKLLSQTFDGQRFQINREKAFVYTHANCYAIEGLIYLHESKYGNFSREISCSANWLAQNQNKDGSVFNYYLNEKTAPLKVADAAAQSVRIWTYTNRNKYEKNITAALNFLKTVQNCSGGIRYCEGSDDINSWASIFTWQALDWHLNKPNIDVLI